MEREADDSNTDSKICHPGDARASGKNHAATEAGKGQIGVSGKMCANTGIVHKDGTSNLSVEQNTDYTCIPVDLADEVSAGILSWNVEDSLKNVARKMIAIVLYTLNVGRADKLNSHLKNKLCPSRFSCPACPEKFSTFAFLKNHQKCTHKK